MDKICSAIGSATLVVAMACSAPNIEPNVPGTRIEITRLRSEPYSFTYNSGFDQAARLVIRDKAAWQAAWQQLYSRSSPVPAPPEIDFSREAVVVAALGQRGTGGYSILIDEATATDAGTSIVIRSISPGAKCGTTQALTQPVDLARIALRQGNVSFVERSEIAQC